MILAAAAMSTLSGVSRAGSLFRENMVESGFRHGFGNYPWGAPKKTSDAQRKVESVLNLW
jgi:hypothetical protein